MIKKCFKCGETKDISEYYKNKTNTDGAQTYCKKCTQVYQKEYLRKPEQQAKTSEYFRKRYEENKEHELSRIRS